jgi:hypothetical protein
MQTIFDKETRDVLIRRIQAVEPDSPARWGRMNAYQMLRHAAMWDEMILRNKTYKRVFIGRLFGRMLLKNEVKDDRPMRPGNPTVPEFKVQETTGDFAAEKRKRIALLNEYADYAFPDNSFIHPFFGKMTREQIGYHAYKHADHHLRQFSC